MGNGKARQVRILILILLITWVETTSFPVIKLTKISQGKGSNPDYSFPARSLIHCSELCLRYRCSYVSFSKLGSGTCLLHKNDQFERVESNNFYIYKAAHKDESDCGEVYAAPQKMNYYEAQAYCTLKHRGHLPIILDEKCQKFTFNQYKNMFPHESYVWIGLERINRDKFYWGGCQLWSRGDNYDKFAPNEPNTEQCTQMFLNNKSAYGKEGEWDDINCRDQVNFFCIGGSINLILVTVEKNFQDARDYCASYENWQLAVIPNEKVLAEVEDNLCERAYEKGVWIGASSPWKNSTFQWIDGSKMGFTKWNKGEPNNSAGNEFCIQIKGRDSSHKKDIMLHDIPCDRKYWFICQHVSSEN